MAKPVIGIVASYDTTTVRGEKRERNYVQTAYVDRVREAGGVPLIVPPGGDPADYRDLVDGWLITGGNDFPGAMFGQDTHPEATTEDQRRLQFEFDFLKSVPSDLPVLGICFGAQLMNIVRGGDLIQHLPDQLGHDNHRGDPVQQYKVKPGSKLAAILGPDAEGKSNHHQAIGTVGEGLAAVAHTDDGVIEAVEDTSGKWWFGLQWHPERTPSETTKRIFRALVDKASEYQKARQ